MSVAALIASITLREGGSGDSLVLSLTQSSPSGGCSPGTYGLKPRRLSLTKLFDIRVGMSRERDVGLRSARGSRGCRRRARGASPNGPARDLCSPASACAARSASWRSRTAPGPVPRPQSDATPSDPRRARPPPAATRRRGLRKPPRGGASSRGGGRQHCERVEARRREDDHPVWVRLFQRLEEDALVLVAQAADVRDQGHAT